jgi:tungstate transport system ATP-binding protein
MPDDGTVLTTTGSLAGAEVLPVCGRDLVVARDGRRLVDSANLALDQPGVTALMGPNGAGKSLLLRLLAGLIAPDQGAVTWAGTVPDRMRASRVGLVFHRPVMLRRTGLANVAFALKVAGIPRAQRHDRALEALASGGLEHLAASPARVLSGGEQQRLALVRALAPEPQALLLDEPTANLDPVSTLAIEELIVRSAKTGMRILLVTHDPAQAQRLADRIAFMHAGQVEAPVSADTFFNDPASARARAFIAGRLVL